MHRYRSARPADLARRSFSEGGCYPLSFRMTEYMHGYAAPGASNIMG